MDSLARKAGRVMLNTIYVLLACILILVAVLMAWSPGKPKPYLDQNGTPLAGSISEKIHVRINGIEQGMFIKSKDATHPVLLYLHGGMPDYFLTEKYPTGLEDYFTVALVGAARLRNLLQRGYSAGDDEPGTVDIRHTGGDELPAQPLPQGQDIPDGAFRRTFVAIQAAARAPELYYAYLGVAQMADQRLSEKLAYDYMLKQFRSNRNLDMVRKLEAAPVTMEGGTPHAYLAIRDVAMHSLGIGTTHDMNSVITGILLPSFASRDYTLMEKVNMWRGKSRAGVSLIWDTMLSTDLSKTLPDLSIPVYFFEGVYDYTCSYTVARSYFERLKAPLKGFYTFERSAHSPMFEEPEKMQKIIREDVLTGANNLADEK